MGKWRRSISISMRLVSHLTLFVFILCASTLHAAGSACKELESKYRDYEASVSDPLPALNFSHEPLTNIIKENVTPNTLVVTDPYNYNEVKKAHPESNIVVVTDNYAQTLQSIVRERKYDSVVGVGGCTALDAARVVAKDREVSLVCTILSTACITVNKGIVKMASGKSEALWTRRPKAAIIAMKTIMDTPKALRDHWTSSGFADCFARISAALDYAVEKNLPLVAGTVRGLVKNTMEALDWSVNEFREFDQLSIARLGHLSNEASVSIMTRGSGTLAVGGEHKFYYQLVEKHPELRSGPSHGHIVGVGTLIATRIAGEKTGDFTLYEQTRAGFAKMAIPTKAGDLAAIGLTPELIYEGLQGVAGQNHLLGQYFMNHDASIIARTFPP